MVAIDPGKSHEYSFRANKAGIYMYHCGTPPVLLHIATGMYGAVIIDPPDLPPVDQEFVMLQSELYKARTFSVRTKPKVARRRSTSRPHKVGSWSSPRRSPGTMRS